jgi:hypothetical protein
MVNFLLLLIGFSENSLWHTMGRRQGRSQRDSLNGLKRGDKNKDLCMSRKLNSAISHGRHSSTFKGGGARVFWTGKFPSMYYSLKAWVLRLLASLGLLVRIPLESWMSSSCECCALSGRGIGVGLITCQGESYRVWCVLVFS